MHFDWTVTLGTLLQIVAMVSLVIVGWSKLNTRLELLVSELRHQADTLKDHKVKLGAIDGRIYAMGVDLARLTGQAEGQKRRIGDSSES